MASARLIPWSGGAAMLGGLVLIGTAVALALRPRGCIGAECGTGGRTMRDSGDLIPFLLIALCLILVGAGGLVVRAQQAGRFGVSGRVGVSVGILGVVLLVIGSSVQAFLFAGDFPQMPLFVIPGMLAIVVGFLLVGLAILRAHVLPRWAAVLLIVSALAMLGFNDQTAGALLAIPFGVAWIAIGYLLVAHQGTAREQ